MAIMNNKLYNELELLTQKIEINTATLADYERYEVLLIHGGLPKEYIFSYLNRAGFSTWNDFYHARNIKNKAKEEKMEAIAIGGLIGLGIGILLTAFGDD